MPGVKAGDLAIIKSDKPCYNGRIVEIIDMAPDCEFILPNGVVHMAPESSPSWVLKAIGGPMPCLFPGTGVTRDVWYGVGADRYLFPLPGDNEGEWRDEPVAITSDQPGASHD